MATYAIGDVQGCYDELQRLLDQLSFDPARDRLWFVGDLVNRGRQSLQVLRLVKQLGNQAKSVLGNHDLHLLALSQGNRKPFPDDTLDDILQAPDRDELIDWLRQRPLLHHSGKRNLNLLHAGLPPQWGIATARERAGEVEEVLRGPEFPEFCRHMYGDEPRRWSDTLRGLPRLRFITNCFTRLRYCTASGKLALQYKGPPGTQKRGYLPWFQVPGRASRDARILCGHWSTLGYRAENNVWALDSGCLWGGRLTALRLGKTYRPIQLTCPGARRPVAE